MTLAIRFNHRYGETFTVPEAAIPGTAARVMDLQHPERKMSKSADSPLGTIGLLDAPEEITRKVRKAVTDTDGEVRYDRATKPGLANLLDLLAAATGSTPQEVARGYTRYGDLKRDVAEALSELLRPVRERRAELDDDPAAVAAVLAGARPGPMRWRGSRMPRRRTPSACCPPPPPELPSRVLWQFTHDDLSALASPAETCGCSRVHRKGRVLYSEHPSLVEQRRIDDEQTAVTRAPADVRPRNALGHCWDGRACDHPDHDPGDPGGGTIHVFL